MATREEIAVQWYTCELTEDIGCGKPLDKRNPTECANCPIYRRLGGLMATREKIKEEIE